MLISSLDNSDSLLNGAFHPNSGDALIWQGGQPRTSKQVMYQTRLKGGLGIPNILQCYQAAQLTKYQASSETPLWVDLEAVDCAPYLFIFCCGYNPGKLLLHPITQHLLQLWDSIKYSGGLLSPHLLLLSIICNPSIPPAYDTHGDFEHWSKSKTTRPHSLLTSRRFKSFTDLQKSYHLPST